MDEHRNAVSRLKVSRARLLRVWLQVTLLYGGGGVMGRNDYVASYDAPGGVTCLLLMRTSRRSMSMPLCGGWQSGVSGGNGVHKYGASGSGFPTQAFNVVPTTGWMWCLILNRW